MIDKLVHITVVRSLWIKLEDNNADIDQAIMESDYYDEETSGHEYITGWYDPESDDDDSGNDWM